MIRKIARTLLIISMLMGLGYAKPSACLGWSLNPFASNNDQTQVRPVSATKTTKKTPSAWEKLTTGTKSFFSKTGETLGLKKKEPKKAPPVVAAKPRVLQPKAKKSGGLFGWMNPQPEQPTKVEDWMQSTKQITP